MKSTYLIEKKKIKNLLDELDNFNSKMDLFSDKYGNIYNYGIDIYAIEDKVSKGSLYNAEITIERNE